MLIVTKTVERVLASPEYLVDHVMNALTDTSVSHLLVVKVWYTCHQLQSLINFSILFKNICFLIRHIACKMFCCEVFKIIRNCK